MVRPNLGLWRQLIAYEQMCTRRPPTVRLVWTRAPDAADADDVQLLPDVYLTVGSTPSYYNLLHAFKGRNQSRSNEQLL
jgi:hypothetical protein